MARENTMTAGSSPRVWGQDLLFDLSSVPLGIIPTRMGTRNRYQTRCGRKQDHPHAYGDKTAVAFELIPLGGSSPRVWGQVCLQGGYLQRTWIIPTRMGTSPNLADFYNVLQGSSPRVWGQVFISTYICTYTRIIPTRMGTRTISLSDILYLWDHPHAYGDKVL